MATFLAYASVSKLSLKEIDYQRLIPPEIVCPSILSIKLIIASIAILIFNIRALLNSVQIFMNSIQQIGQELLSIVLSIATKLRRKRR
jgi:uncharacterized membrane protein